MNNSDKQITKTAFARAGLLGNPSDGYYGKIIAVSVKNFFARVELTESKRLQFQPAESDRDNFDGLDAFFQRVQMFGYYGGLRLVKAAVKKFVEYCKAGGLDLHSRNFSLRYFSNIPRQLGLGGSSAIITAAIRGLMEFYDISIPPEIQPSLILSAELEELGINAGFMDRVVQVYEGCVYMDLDGKFIQARGYGRYERLDATLVPPLYLAYQPALGKVSGRILNEIRVGYERKDPQVLQSLARIAEIASKGRLALTGGNTTELHGLMDENFDLRSRIMTISAGNRELIDTARRCGASAKFAGSGGSIVGMYSDDAMYHHLEQELSSLGAVVLKPVI